MAKINLQVEIEAHDCDSVCANSARDAVAVLCGATVNVYQGPNFSKPTHTVYVDDKSALVPFKEGWLAFGATGASYINLEGTARHLLAIGCVHAVEEEIILGSEGFATFADNQFVVFPHKRIVNDVTTTITDPTRFLMADSEERVYLVNSEGKSELGARGSFLHKCALFYAVERPGHSVTILNKRSETLTREPWALFEGEYIKRVDRVFGKKNEGAVITNKRAIAFKILRRSALIYAICEGSDIENVYNGRGFFITESPGKYRVWLDERVGGLAHFIFTKNPSYATVAMQAMLSLKKGEGNR